MIAHRQISSISILAALGLWSCSGPSGVAAGPGNGSETEGLSARILDASRTPVANALVRVRPANLLPDTTGIAPPAAWSTTSDASGRVRFRGLAAGAWRLEVRKGASGVLTTVQLRTDTALPDIQTLSVIRLSGRVALPDGVSRGWIRILGTDHLARVDSSGNWKLDSVPQGAVVVRADAGASKGTWPIVVDAKPSQDAGVLVLPGTPIADAVELDSLVLETFDRGDGTRHAWGELIGGGAWWVSDSGKNFVPTLAHHSIANGLGAAETWSGRSFHVKRTPETGWTTLGMEFDQAPGTDSNRVWHDLRTLDSIVFWAKGQGKLGVKITGKWEKTSLYYAAAVNLDASWRRFAIAADAQVSTKIGAPLWRTLADSSQGLAFVVNDTSEVWLDQIVLKGVSPAKLWPRLRSP